MDETVKELKTKLRELKELRDWHKEIRDELLEEVTRVERIAKKEKKSPWLLAQVTGLKNEANWHDAHRREHVDGIRAVRKELKRLLGESDGQVDKAPKKKLRAGVVAKKAKKASRRSH